MSVGLGDVAPDFTAETTEGPISFHEWKGKSWAVLFSHPKAFTPVCTTELGAVAALKPEFDKRNTKVIGLSVDPLTAQQTWQGDIKDVTGHAVNFPMIADHDKKVANLYGMIHPAATDTMTVRSVFVIGPDNKVKLTLTYPASTGRNFQELHPSARLAAADRRLLGRDPRRLEAGRGRDHHRRGQRRGCQDEVPEGLRREEAVPAGHAAAGPVREGAAERRRTSSRRPDSGQKPKAER